MFLQEKTRKNMIKYYVRSIRPLRNICENKGHFDVVASFSLITFYEDSWNLLFIGTCLFFIGLFGVLLSRANLIKLLMCLELSLLGVGYQFLAHSFLLNDLRGQIGALLVLTVAGVESAIGLAIFLSMYRLQGSIKLSKIENLRG